MVGLRVALLAKESVAASQQSSAGWMPESTGRLSIGVGCKHSVTICKASYRKLFIMGAATLNWCTVLSC